MSALPLPQNSANFISRSLNRHFVWWSVGVVIIIFLAGTWFIIPLWQEARSGQVLEEARDQLQKAQTDFQQLKAQGKLWDKLLVQQSGQDINLMVPDAPNLPDVLFELESLVRDAGFDLLSISAVDVKDTKTRSSSVPSGARAVKVSLSLDNGSYLKFKTLLGNLRSAWRLLSLENFNFSGRETAYSVELTTYYMP